MIKHLPNALTVTRFILAPIVAYALYIALSLPLDAASEPLTYPDRLDEAEGWALLAAGLFVFAALTDLFDGMAARALQTDSKFGRILDPIADKALVGLPLLAVSFHAYRADWPFWAAIAGASAIIVGRDSLMTILRLTARDGEGARVSSLAKWKTALELVCVGCPVLLAAAPALVKAIGAGDGFSASPLLLMGWTVLLGATAALSALTAVQYLTPPKSS
jgi:cardiolipin synthase